MLSATTGSVRLGDQSSLNRQGLFLFFIDDPMSFCLHFISQTLTHNLEKVQTYNLSFFFVKGSTANLFFQFCLFILGEGKGWEAQCECNGTELNHRIIKSQNSYLFIENKCWSFYMVTPKTFSSKSPVEIKSINWLLWIACSNKYFSNENMH